jgi:hypothetical protein
VVDWPKIRDLLARGLPQISRGEDLAELVAAMQGGQSLPHVRGLPAGRAIDEVGGLGVHDDRAHGELPQLRCAAISG